MKIEILKIFHYSIGYVKNLKPPWNWFKCTKNIWNYFKIKRYWYRGKELMLSWSSFVALTLTTIWDGWNPEISI